MPQVAVDTLLMMMITMMICKRESGRDELDER